MLTSLMESYMLLEVIHLRDSGNKENYMNNQKRIMPNFDVDSLFPLQENVVHPVKLAFSHMISISENNDFVYETDFVDGKVKEQRYGSPYPSATEYEPEECLSKVNR